MAKVFKAPENLLVVPSHGECPGCGHGIVTRIIFEVVEEMGMMDKVVAFHDVACGANMGFVSQVDMISGGHGRVIPTAAGYKRIRPENLVFGYAGDGAFYSIRMQHTVHAAARNENITVIAVNNTVFGMTGGQMSPTSMIGQRTTSSPAGRVAGRNGNPINIENLYHGMDIAYLARGAVDSVAHVNQTKKYIKKAFEKQMAGEGYTFVEVLSMCPTNWGLTPLDSAKRIQDEVLEQYPMGEFIERSAK